MRRRFGRGSRRPENSPNFHVDITDYLPVKLEAMRLYASQIREPEFHGSPESLELLTRF